MANVKTTSGQFERFKKVALATAEFVGLNDWELRFKQGTPGGALAYSQTQVVAQVATFSLVKSASEELLTAEKIDYCAVHETVHAFLAPIADLANARFVTRDEVTQAVERVTVRLTKLLLPMIVGSGTGDAIIDTAGTAVEEGARRKKDYLNVPHEWIWTAPVG